MAITRPTGEQLRFRSAATGDHILDTYMENSEKGSRTLPDLLDDLFDSSGVFRSANFEFRFDATTDKIQFRAGNFANSTTGWTDITTFFNITGAFNASTTYNNFDLITLSTKDVYIVHGLSAGATFADEAAVIASANTDKLVDVSEAREWAIKTDGQVSSTDYSSKAWAIGGTGVTNTASKGAAKEWATKTGSTVDGSDYSAKHWATTGTVATVSSGIANINTVAAAIANVNTTATNISNVNTVAGISANVTTVAGIAANVTTVATNNANVTTVATNNSNINSLATNMTDINTVADEIDNNKLQTVADNINAVVTAADDLNESTSEIEVVANNIASVNTVGGAIANVNTVAGIAANVTTVAGIAANTTTVAGIAANVTTVAGIAADVTTAATNTTAFNNLYLGAQSSAPTQDPDGSALDLGDLYFDTSTNTMKVYAQSGWTAAGSSVNGTADRFYYTSTAGQTTFTGADANGDTLAYDSGYADIFMNGVKLAPADYTASNGTSVVLASGAALNDTIEIIAYGTFVLSDHYTKTQADARYANISGDTMTGDLTVPNIVVTGTVDGIDIAARDAVLTSTTTTANAALPKSGGAVTGNVTFGDNNKAIFGGELEIYSDATHARIREYGSGQLKIQGDNMQLLTSNGASTYLEGNASTGAVTLYHASNAPRVATTSFGAQITGSLAVDTITNASSSTDVTIDTNFDIILDAGGGVGIGTSSPNTYSGYTVLTLDNATNGGIIDIERGGNLIGEIFSFDSSTFALSAVGDRAINFSTNSSERMRITSAGNLGIGNTNPSSPLTVTSNSGANALSLRARSNDDYAFLQFHDHAGSTLRGQIFNHNGAIGFSTSSSSTERMTITSEGNLGLGTTSPTNYGSSYKTLAVNGSSAASIEGFVNGTLTGYFQSYGGYVIFASKTNVPLFLAQNDTVRAAIDTSGNFHVGKTAVNNNAGCTLYDHGQAYFVTGAGEATLLVNNSGGSNSTNTLIQFYRNSSGVGTVTTSGTSTSYNTSSDYRLKTDVQQMTGASARVQALNPVNFEWIADGTRVDGFLAHEAATVVPEAVHGTKDAMKDEEYEISAATGEIYTPLEAAYVDEDGEEVDATDEVIHSTDVVEPETLAEGQLWRQTTEAVMGTRSVIDPQGIDQAKLVPLLTAALQEALTEITSLKARVTALEAN